MRKKIICNVDGISSGVLIAANTYHDYPTKIKVQTQNSDELVASSVFAVFKVGGYNLVYKADDGKRVFKQRTRASEVDKPERAVDVWNKINPDFLAELARAKGTLFNSDEEIEGWVAPFIEGTEPSDNEICEALDDIYKRTGRIVTDAFMPGNFVKTSDGKIVCIDVGAALLLKKPSADYDFWYTKGIGKATRVDFDKNREKRSTVINKIEALLKEQEKIIAASQPEHARIESISGDEGSLGTSPAGSITFWKRSPQPEKLTAEQQLSVELIKTLRGYLRRFPEPDEQKIAHCKTLIHLADGLQTSPDKAVAIKNFTLALEGSIDWNIVFQGLSVFEPNHDNLSSSFSFGISKIGERFKDCLEACGALLDKYRKSAISQLSVPASQSPRDSSSNVEMRAP